MPPGRSCEGSFLCRGLCTTCEGSVTASILGDPRFEITASCCAANDTGCTGVRTIVAVSIDCGRPLVPATRDMLTLGREGRAKERANEEKEGKLDGFPGTCGTGSCFGGTGKGWPSALAQASRALCSSWCSNGSNAFRISACADGGPSVSSSGLIPPEARSSSTSGLGVWRG